MDVSLDAALMRAAGRGFNQRDGPTDQSTGRLQHCLPHRVQLAGLNKKSSGKDLWGVTAHTTILSQAGWTNRTASRTHKRTCWLSASWSSSPSQKYRKIANIKRAGNSNGSSGRDSNRPRRRSRAIKALVASATEGMAVGGLSCGLGLFSNSASTSGGKSTELVSCSPSKCKSMWD